MKFCVDCKWHSSQDERVLFAKIPIHTCTGVLNEITGKPMVLSCYEARLRECRGAALFTPKDSPDTGGCTP